MGLVLIPASSEPPVALGFGGAAALGSVSVITAIPIYMLELFVAFIQAYVFTFLVTVFLGAAVHPEH